MNNNKYIFLIYVSFKGNKDIYEIAVECTTDKPIKTEEEVNDIAFDFVKQYAAKGEFSLEEAEDYSTIVLINK